MKKMFFVMAVLVTALIGVAGCNQSHSPKTNNGGGGGGAKPQNSPEKTNSKRNLAVLRPK